MYDFWYHNPTRIIFGANKVNEIGGVIKEFGEKILFVYGQKSIKQSGLYFHIKDLLASESLQVIEFGGVVSNPLIDHVRDGIKVAKNYGVDCILAVGGGSVIDSAKAIAFGVCTDKDIWSFFSDRIKPDKALPIFTVPTISGSGSEMNSGAVLSNSETKQKLAIGALCLAPKVSILDPTLTLTVPLKYTFYGLVDALSHILESYFNSENLFDSIQDRMCEGLMLSLFDITPRLLANLENYQYRGQAMWISCLAHNGILNTGRGKVVYKIHSIAHELGASSNMPHGEAISVSIPMWLDSDFDKLKNKIDQFEDRVITVHKLKGWLNGTV